MGFPKSQNIPDKFDNSFYWLASEITRVLASNKDDTTQKQQVEELLDAERKFRDTILKYKQANEIYKKFLQKICLQNKNILSARPYFRETSVVFRKSITPAIKDQNLDALKKFNLNYQFIKFIRQSWLGPFPKRADSLYKRVELARTKLIENNLPLVVNRAKLFFRKTPKSHLTLLDMIGICALGLASGVDKWVGEYSPVWRSVAIGRMVGNLIDSYSETALHFFPKDRRVLYKAHSIRGRQGIDDIIDLAEAINESFKEDAKQGKNVPKEKVTSSELSELMSASSTISADSTVNEEGCGIYSYIADESQDTEKLIIERDSYKKVLGVIGELPTVYRKILKLKGVKL
jgi:DNA-directed RNA polymerase specialized sigma subunit